MSAGGPERFAPDLVPLVRPIADLREDPANVRRHSVRNIDAVTASLVRFGQQKPIVVRPDGTIVAALDRDEAALRAKLADLDGVTALQLRVLDRVLKIMGGRWRLLGLDRGDGANEAPDPEREALRSMPFIDLVAKVNRTLKEQYGIDPPLAPPETKAPAP